MKLVTDFDFLLNTFIIIGIPLYGDTRNEIKNLKSVAKLGLKIITELLFTSFATYIVLNCIFGFPERNPLFRLTSSAMSIIILILRMHVSMNRTHLRRMIYDLQSMIRMHQTKPYASKKRQLALVCFLSIAFPLSVSFVCVLLMLQHYEEIRYSLKPGVFQPQHPTSVLAMLLIFSTAYTLHFFVIPTLFMTLFHFVYATFEDALKQVIQESSRRLTTSSSFEADVQVTLSAIAKASRVHQSIEDVLSPGVFMLYILVFANFLNLVTANAAGLTESLVVVRSLACAFVFAWTCGCFVRLTLRGSRLPETCALWTSLRRDVASSRLLRRQEETLPLLMLGSVDRLEMSFTGWGMFQLERGLLLSMVGVVVSYGVLIATT